MLTFIKSVPIAALVALAAVLLNHTVTARNAIEFTLILTLVLVFSLFTVLARLHPVRLQDVVAILLERQGKLPHIASIM